MYVTRIPCYILYSVWYYPRFHVTAVGLGTYYQWIRGTLLYLKPVIRFHIRCKSPITQTLVKQT
jgi:hypothetical protein